MVIRKSSDISNNFLLDDCDEHPSAKRMKICAFDCKVILGTERYEYPCYFFCLTFQSGFFKDFLKVSAGGSIRIFELPDVSPRIWGLMMHMANFSDSGDMNGISKISDLMQVIEKLKKYRFHKALTTCEMLVSKIFITFSKKLRSNPLFVVQRINKLIDLAYLCDRVQLDGSKVDIANFFRRALALPSGGNYRACGFVYKKKQVERLAPLIAKEKLLGNRWTQTEILCPHFPSIYLATLSKAVEEERLQAIQNKAAMKGAILRPPEGDCPKAGYLYEEIDHDDSAFSRLVKEFGDDPNSAYYLGPP